MQLFGVFIAMLGAVGLIWGNADDVYSGNLYYTLYILIAMVMYAFSLNQIKFFSSENKLTLMLPSCVNLAALSIR